jgi:hypothetical protein
MNDQQQLNSLETKRATLLSHLEMLSSVADEFYTKLGKVETEIFLLKRKIIRETKNIINED